MSRLFDEVYEHRDEARAVLERIKCARRHLPVRYERVDESTWVERQQNPDKLFKKQEIMEPPVTRHDAEQAIAIYRTAKSAKTRYEAQMAEAERIIENFGRTHLSEFVDGRLELDSGTLAVKAGPAKPLKAGRPLTTAARIELASRLPAAYLRSSCDFSELYGCTDKMVRQMLLSRGIEIVRDDKFIVL